MVSYIFKWVYPSIDVYSLFALSQYNIGEWTHVGVVYPRDDIPFKNRNEGNLYIWESVISGIVFCLSQFV